MGTTERRNEIMQILKNQGTIDVQALAKRTGVSNMTIRNDLTFLSNQGLVVRTYGGAVLANQKDMLRLVSNVLKENIAQKKDIAAKAATLVRGGMKVLIDTGSTTFQLVPHLIDCPITIVTNSLLIANQIKSDSVSDLVLIGGQLSKYCMGFVGPEALSILNNIFVDILFLGTAGLSLEDGILTCESLQEADIKRTMIKHAKKVVLLADSCKFNKKTFASFGNITDVDLLITDKMPSEDIQFLSAQNVEVSTIL